MSHDDDRDLSALYRAGATEEPPASLDRRIEKAAREVDRPSIWERLSGGGWRLGFSAFALVVLSVSLVTLVHEEAPFSAEVGAPPAAGMSSPDAPGLSNSSPTSTNGGAPAPAPERARRTPPISRPLADLEVQREPAGEVRRRAEPVEAPLEKRDVPVFSTERRAPATPPAQQKPEAVTEEGVAEASPPPPARANIPAVPSSDDRRISPAMKSVPRAYPGIGRSDSAAAGDSATESPDLWLARIEKLVREGREQEAALEMHRFRGRHPGHPVPPSLKHLVE